MTDAPTADARDGRVVLGIGLGLSALFGGLALGLGSQPVGGEFGVTGQPVTCGSVWGLRSTGDLNALTCVPDLRTRVTVVAVLVGASVAAAAVGLTCRGAPGHRTTPTGARWLAAGLALSVLVVVALVSIGRLRIWSVAGA